MIDKLFRKVLGLILMVTNQVEKIFINAYFRVRCLFVDWPIVKNKLGESNVLISLTSIPARIAGLHLVIKSLMLQTERPAKIILWLSDDNFESRELPRSLSQLLGPMFDVRWVDDLRPHKKYYFAMQEYPNMRILTVDDDGIYRKRLVEQLLKAQKKFPGTVCCTRAHKIKVGENSEILPYNRWEYETKDVYNPSNYIFATGAGGVIYPPYAFGNKAFDASKIRELSLDADDVWLKAMEIVSDRQVVAIPSRKNSYVVGILDAERVRLSKKNVLSSANDVYIHNVFSEYGVKL